MEIIDGAEIWKLHATHGFPLELSLPELAAREIVPSWDRLLEAAKADGTNIHRLVLRLIEVVYDSYPNDFAQVIEKKLPLLEAKLA